MGGGGSPHYIEGGPPLHITTNTRSVLARNVVGRSIECSAGRGAGVFLLRPLAVVGWRWRVRVRPGGAPWAVWGLCLYVEGGPLSIYMGGSPLYIHGGGGSPSTCLHAV